MTAEMIGIYEYMKGHRMVCWLSLSILTLGLALLLASLTYKEDISDFLPENNKYSKALKVYQDLVGANKIIVIAQNADSTEIAPDTIARAVDLFVEKLEKTEKGGQFSNLTYQMDQNQVAEMISYVYQNIPYFLTPADYLRIDSLLCKPDFIPSQLAADKQLLMLPASSLLSENIQRDPLNLFTPVVAGLQSNMPAISFENYDGYIFTPDMQRAIMMMDSPFGASETEKNGTLIETLDSIARQVHIAIPSVSFHLTGGPVIAVGNATQIKKDSLLSITIAIILIVLLLIYVFRRVWSILMIVVSIGWGWLFAMGGMALLHDSVSVIVIGISSVILGIAVNYPLHLIAHLQHTPNMETTLKEISKPLIIGNITTVGAFLALVPLKSVALRDLGLFSSLLLIGTIIFVLIFLPHTLKMKQRVRDIQVLSKVSELSLDNKRWLVVCVLILTIVFGYLSGDTVFDPDMNHINYMSKEQKDDMSYFQQLISSSMTGQTVYIFNSTSDIDSSLEMSQTLSYTIAQLEKEGLVKGRRSCSHFLCSQAEQEKRISRWKKFVSEHGEDMERRVRISAKNENFQESSFDDFFEILHADYNLKPMEYFSPLTETVFASNISVDSIAHQVNVVDMVYTNESDVEEVIAKIEKEHPEMYAFDVQGMNSSIATRLSDDFNYIGWACGLIVFVFLWLSFGSIELAILSFIPMAVSWIWILGIMSVMDIHFNVVNIILATFIFGQGDDYTIFMTEGCQYEYAYRRKVLSSYKSSIIVSALIMFIGIGALIFAKHPALHSLAQITIIGMFSVVMMAYLFPPLIFKWLVSVNGTYRVRPISIRRLFVTGFSAVVFFIQLATVYLLGGILFGIFRGKSRSKRIFRDYVRMCFWYDMNHIWGVHFNYINSSDEDFVKPAVIVCNHQSMLDTAFLMAVSSKIIIVANSHASSHFVTKKVFQWMDFYTIPDQESADIPHLSELVKEGYSIVVFPEGTRNEKSSILRFHKGAFYLAEKLHLDIVPIYLHGVNHVFPRNTLCTYPGKVTLEIGDRIKYGDKDYYGHDYKECTRLMRNLYNKKFQLMKKQYETIEYYVPFVLDRYRYRGTEIFRSVKRNLKNYKRQAEKYNSIDSSFIIVHNSGWGELSLLLALTKPDATIISVEKDEEKLLVSGIAAENVVNNITYMTELKENDESKSPYIINL